MGLLNLSGHVPANGFWTQLNEERQLLHSIRKRKISYMYYGHITRKTKKKYKDESVVIDQEDDREGDGQRTSLTGLAYKSTRQSGSRRTATDGIMLCSSPTLLEDGTRRRRRRSSDLSEQC